MNKNAHLAGLGFATIFGFSSLFSKLTLSYIPPMGLLAYHFLIASLTFYILKVIGVIRFKFERHMIFALLPVIIFQPVLYFIFETYGLNLTSSGEAGLMIALIPIFVALLSALLLKEKPSLIQVLFILTSVSGVVLIQSYKSFELGSPIWGFLLLFGSVLAAAFFNIASRHAHTSYRATEITYMMMFAGAITFNTIYIIELLIKGQIVHYVSDIININVFIPVFVLGAFISTCGFCLVNYTLHHMPAHISSIYTNLSTIVALIAGMIFLHESVTIYHIIGSVLIIIGVYGTIVFQNKKAAKEATLKAH